MKMRYRIWHTAVMALLIGTQGSLCTVEAQASGLFDWLSRCGSDPEPQIVCYPMSAADCCEPSVYCQSPDPCCPPMVVSQPKPSFWQRIGSCGGSPQVTAPPQTYYRTNWKKIPVTSYRPVVSSDPVTGCPVTVMKPCTTYTWQPERQRCSWFDRLLGRCDPPTTEVQCCVPTTCCGPSEYMMSGVSSGCCEPTMSSITPVPASPAPTPAPYYVPSPPSVLTVPQGGVSPAPTLAPQGTSPATGGFPQGTQPPAAETRPTLKPAEVTPESPADSRLPQSGLPWNSAPASPAATGTQDLQPMPALGPPVVNPENSRLSPVPDPDATPVAPTEESNPPPLLNPRDQVASLRTGQPWAVTTITWPASRRASTDRTPTTPPRRDLREWDESGWESVGK